MAGGGKDDKGGFANPSKVVYPFWVDEDGKILKPHVNEEGGLYRLVVSDTSAQMTLNKILTQLETLNTYMAEIVGEDLG